MRYSAGTGRARIVLQLLIVSCLSLGLLGLKCSALTGDGRPDVDNGGGCGSTDRTIEQTTDNSSDNIAGSNEKLAQSFSVTTSTKLYSVEFYFNGTLAGSTATVELWAGGSGPFSGSAVASSSVTSGFDNSKHYVEFKFPGYPNLAAGTTYYFVVSGSNGTTIELSSSDKYSGGAWFHYVSPAWGAAQSKDAVFRVNTCR